MSVTRPRTPAALIVLDGWGWREDPTHNAIAEADTPFFDHLVSTFPHAVFDASGSAVGLPDGQMGNSEIGHMAIGAGMPIDTDLVRINKAIESEQFDSRPVLQELFAHVRASGGTLHVVGLVSDGGIHSHEQHMYAVLAAARRAHVPQVAVHAILDGRDAPPQSGAGYLRTLAGVLQEQGGYIASVVGRYYAMDRDNNWDRVDRAVAAMVDGAAAELCMSGEEASSVVAARYAAQVFDEHVQPMVFAAEEGKARQVLPGDAVFVFNFRADRARMLIRRFVERLGGPERRIMIASMTEYDPSMPVGVVFPPVRPEITLADVVEQAGLTQAHIAETEKYAHATYFLNGGKETPHAHEAFVLIESRKDVATHDEAPEMRAQEITDALLERLAQGTDFFFVNYANADMVGHTAHVPAIRTAVETIDRELRRVVEAIAARGGFTFITADHGNAEQNFDHHTNERHTAHTLNKVPAILTDTAYQLSDGVLPDVAPTMLTLMGLPVPPTMTGTSRAVRKN